MLVGIKPHEIGSIVMCELYPEEKAIAVVTYGLYSEFQHNKHHKHKLSKKALDELWLKCKPLVNIGCMHWTLKPI